MYDVWWFDNIPPMKPTKIYEKLLREAAWLFNLIRVKKKYQFYILVSQVLCKQYLFLDDQRKMSRK